jgi:hypothetical protein
MLHVALVGKPPEDLLNPFEFSMLLLPLPVRTELKQQHIVAPEEPSLFCAPRPTRSLTRLSVRNLATGGVFATFASPVYAACPACRPDLRLRNV